MYYNLNLPFLVSLDNTQTDEEYEFYNKTIYQIKLIILQKILLNIKSNTLYVVSKLLINNCIHSQIA